MCWFKRKKSGGTGPSIFSAGFAGPSGGRDSWNWTQIKYCGPFTPFLPYKMISHCIYICEVQIPSPSEIWHKSDQIKLHGAPLKISHRQNQKMTRFQVCTLKSSTHHNCNIFIIFMVWCKLLSYNLVCWKEELHRPDTCRVALPERLGLNILSKLDFNAIFNLIHRDIIMFPRVLCIQVISGTFILWSNH